MGDGDGAEMENKATVLRVYQAFHNRDLRSLDELLAPDFVDHTAGPEQAPGPEGIKQAWARMFAAYPALRITVEDLVAEGYKVASRVIFSGAGPDGTSEATMMEMAHVSGGKVVELWNIVKWT
ncbi:MAG: ester cyclase [Chloroflexia bacterium]